MNVRNTNSVTGISNEQGNKQIGKEEIVRNSQVKH